MKTFLAKLPFFPVVLILSVLFSILFTYPAVTKLSGELIGDGGDNYEYAAYQGLAAKNIREGKILQGHETYWRYPQGFDFSRGFDSYLTLASGTIFTLLFGLPTGYNLSVLFLMTLNGVLSFLFFNSLTRSKILGIAGMVIYGFSFYTIAKAASHPNLLFVGAFPFFAYSILNFLRQKQLGKQDFALFFASILLTALGSLQYLLILSIGAAATAGIAYVTAPQVLKLLALKLKLHIRDALLPLFVFAILFLILFLPYLSAIITGKFIFIERYDLLYALSPAFSDYIFPNPYLKLFASSLLANGSTPSIEKVVFMGWGEIVLFCAFLLSSLNKKLKLFLGGLFLIFVILSYGGALFSPYRILGHFFPFSSIIETGRYVVLFYFFATCAILLFLKTKTKLAIIAVVLLLVILERTPQSFHFSDTLVGSKYLPAVRQAQSKAVLDLPLSLYYPRYNLLSLYYQKPIITGYFHWSADGRQERSFIFDNFINRYECSDKDDILISMDRQREEAMDFEMLKALRQNGVETIVVHKDDKFYHEVCKNMRMRLSRLAPFTKTAKFTSETMQDQITGQSIDGYASFNIYLPSAGTFYLDGVFIDPALKGEFDILINGQTGTFPYTFIQTYKNNAVELDPKNTINFPVEAGTVVSIVSKQPVGNASFSAWYRYVSDGNSQIPYTERIETIFEDESATVYKIN